MTAARKRKPLPPVANGVLGPRRNIRRTSAQIRADHEAEMAQRSAARWARWEGQERFGDDG
jgi:hypothetical protein